ncbi:hypothetical protein [Staphylococcus equorum]|uniref:hypothetical protein n=1 Tax=Staphylococcus equorum TaxID=246432 RepID=UPI003D8088C0
MYWLSDENLKEIEPITFAEMNMKEKDIEALLRQNIEIITSEEESLLIIGEQVKNKENARSDLTAIDHRGNMVLIEIKRDLKDIKQRAESFEFQAIRYAASYATIETVEEIVDKIYAPYINKHQDEYLGDLKKFSITELANRKITQFLETNNALDSFNKGQRIILVASDFDPQTLSAAAWLNENGIQISCYKLAPYLFNGQYILNAERIVPMTKNEEYFIEIGGKKQFNKNKNYKTVTKPRLREMLSWNVIQTRDIIRPKNTNIKGVILENGLIMDKGEEKSLNQFVKDALEWSSVKPYTLAIHEKTGKSLSQIRLEYMENNNMI